MIVFQLSTVSAEKDDPISSHSEPAKPVPFSKLFSLDKAHRLVLVDPDYSVKGIDWFYKPYAKPVKIDAKLLNVLKSVKDTTIEEQFAPFVGILGYVAVLDAAGKPICLLSVVNWNSTFSVSDVKIEQNRILSGDILLQGQSEPFARWMYEQIKHHNPERIEMFNKAYKKRGSSLEDQLFPQKIKNSG